MVRRRSSLSPARSAHFVSDKYRFRVIRLEMFGEREEAAIISSRRKISADLPSIPGSGNIMKNGSLCTKSAPISAV